MPPQDPRGARQGHQLAGRRQGTAAARPVDGLGNTQGDAGASQRWRPRGTMWPPRDGRSSYLDAGGEACVVPWPLDGAVAAGCEVAAPPPRADPGCSVLFSVPDALGRLFVVSGAELLEFPAGGLCMVVSGFCARAGAAPKMANAMISVLMTDIPSLLRGGRAGRALPSLLSGMTVPAGMTSAPVFSNCWMALFGFCLLNHVQFETHSWSAWLGDGRFPYDGFPERPRSDWCYELIMNAGARRWRICAAWP